MIFLLFVSLEDTMRKIIFLKAACLFMILGLSGCAKQMLHKPFATQANFEADKSACEYEAIKHAGGFDNSYSALGSSVDMALRRNEITLACLKQKGWRPAK